MPQQTSGVPRDFKYYLALYGDTNRRDLTLFDHQRHKRGELDQIMRMALREVPLKDGKWFFGETKIK